MIVVVSRPRAFGRCSLPSLDSTHEVLILTIIFHYVFLSVF
jgi:hypothetical protein